MPDVFARDPVNLIRMFRLAQKHSLVLHPDAMRAANKSLKLIDGELRQNAEANRLFLEILTSQRRRNHPAADERDRRARAGSYARSGRSSR